jgi:hypothetical protein
MKKAPVCVDKINPPYTHTLSDIGERNIIPHLHEYREERTALLDFFLKSLIQHEFNKDCLGDAYRR